MAGPNLGLLGTLRVRVLRWLTIDQFRSLRANKLARQVNMIIDDMIWQAQLDQLIDAQAQDLLQHKVQVILGAQVPDHPV